LKENRDRALLAVLLACGLRRHEAVELNFGHIQQREEHWAIFYLKGKAGYIRTIPVPTWVKNFLDQWLQAANITSGQLLSSCAQDGESLGREADGKGCVARGSGVCRESRYRQVSAERSPQDLCTALSRRGRRNWSRFSFCSVTFRFKQPNDPRLQTADSRCRQRQNWDRATGLNEPRTFRFADHLPGIRSNAVRAASNPFKR